MRSRLPASRLHRHMRCAWCAACPPCPEPQALPWLFRSRPARRMSELRVIHLLEDLCDDMWVLLWCCCHLNAASRGHAILLS